MSSLPTQPFQAGDFSGGTTDNFIAGGPTRYMAADNFWVTVDRKLEERYGSQCWLVAPQLPSGNAPVNALVTHDNEQFLLGVACPNVYVLNQNSHSILGYTGNPPLVGGDYQNQISWGEWSHHTFMTDDSLSHTPVMVYRGAPYPANPLPPYSTNIPVPAIPNPLNQFAAITAGLPAMVGSVGNMQVIGTALQSCINLANDLRTQMLAHMNDAGSPGVINTNLHVAFDAPSIAILNASTAAHDQNSLFSLITALIAAYEPHVSDVIEKVGSSVFHFIIGNQAIPLNYHLASTATPVDLTDAAAILDDLKTKFFMHEMAPYTHDSFTKYAIIGRHLVTAPHIGQITSGPVAVPSYIQSITLANSLKASLNAHESDTTEHTQPDVNDQIDFPDCFDLDTLYVMIIWLRLLYTIHVEDSANSVFQHITANIAIAGSGPPFATLSNITLVSQQPPNVTLFVAWNVYDPSGDYFSPFVPLTTATYTTNTTATTTRNSGSVGTAIPLTLTTSKYHIGLDTNSQGEELGGTGSLAVLTQYSPTAGNFGNWLSLLTQLQDAYNAHDQNAVVHILADANQNSASVPTAASYSFSLIYFYQYMRYDGVIFDLVGPPLLLAPIVTETISPTYTVISPINGQPSVIPASTAQVTMIPPLTQSGQSNYDIANVQIEIYRTISNGSTYFLEGRIPNGQTTFTSQLPDQATPQLSDSTSLINQPTLYTTGGVVNFDPAPICKYVTILQNTAYYASVIDAGQVFSNRIRQSIQNSPWASPGSFFIDLPDIITGISSTRNNLLAFCQNSIYQVSGLFNQLGQGQMIEQSISDTIGCVSSASIVKTDVGIFFAGTDGFYYTDGFQLIKLSSEFNLTYASLVTNAQQKHAIYGCYDRYNRRVWWSTQPQESDWSATQNYIFHVNFGVNANGVFTTASNFENYRPSSMVFWQGQQLRGDARGYMFLHSSFNKTDPQININTATTTWHTVIIPYFYASCALDFGTTFNRKWLTRIAIQNKNVGNVSIQVTSISDNGRVKPLLLSPLLARPNLMWGDARVIWGAPNSVQPITWDDAREIDGWRRFPATQLRADFKQVTFSPAFTGIYSYDKFPPGSGSEILPQGGGVANVYLITPPGFTALSWPLDVVGYTYAQQSDNFTINYPITGLISTINPNDTLVISDPTNSLPNLFVAWVIRGQLKEQRVSLTSYNIHFTLLGKMQHAYQGVKDSGENAPGASYNQIVRDKLATNDGQIIETNDGQEIDA